MEIVDPRVDPALVPLGSRPLVFAEHQPQYQPLPSIRTPDGKVITRWTLTDSERAAIVRGEDVFLTVLTFNQPLQPVLLTVGPIDWNAT